jgi:hypothetical protein
VLWGSKAERMQSKSMPIKKMKKKVLKVKKSRGRRGKTHSDQ